MWETDHYLRARGGVLHIDGVSALDLAAQFGTPLFVFSEARIQHNISAIQGAFAHPRIAASLFYASKANGNLAVLQAIRQRGMNVEVNSGGELYKARRAGFAPDQIVFNGVAKTVREIDAAVEQGIFCLNVDSAFELGRVIDVARRRGRRASIALRMVPEVGAALHGGLATGTHATKFGIGADELGDVYREALAHPDQVDLIGLHVHMGAQMTDLAQYGDGVRALLTTALALADATGHRVEYLNIGGGLPVPYLKPEAADVPSGSTRTMLSAGITPMDMAQTVFAAFEAVPGADAFTKLMLEPGSSIIADTAVLLATVENIKTRASTGNTWLLLDAGFNTLMDVLGYTWYFHAVAAGQAARPADTPYQLGGPLCDSGDVYHDSEGYGRLPDHRLLPANLRPGDVIAFLDTGGYTLEQMNQYNGQPRAAAVLIRRDGAVQLIRRRDTDADLVAHDLELDDQR